MLAVSRHNGNARMEQVLVLMRLGSIESIYNGNDKMGTWPILAKGEKRGKITSL
ncbi:hypothetical protein EDWATA_00510 [Edwardsiella tarda ATCC 23685]|uniref:Uncharacterized protein n=1 Tax=Edwardsiella tarda ATCC 23685 TaxID=500638 RepID=D4F1C6_EDWTA|nr:hypothetical protein EDWATA_00510 [Edwardsiella tarda ATCC 23685]